MIIFEVALKWLYFKSVSENVDNYMNYPKVNPYNPTRVSSCVWYIF